MSELCWEDIVPFFLRLEARIHALYFRIRILPIERKFTNFWVFRLVGGVMSAGNGRLTAAGKKGLPQVVSLGALDMVNFGARSSVPEKFGERLLVEHNPSITLMRTTPKECEKLGEILSQRLRNNCNDSAKVEVWVPSKGVSMMAEKGGKFYDEEADKALIKALVRGLEGSGIKLQEKDLTINDPEFATGMAKRLLEMMTV